MSPDKWSTWILELDKICITLYHSRTTYKSNYTQNLHFSQNPPNLVQVPSSFLLVCFRNIVLRPNEMTQRDILAGAISEVLWKVGLLNVKVNSQPNQDRNPQLWGHHEAAWHLALADTIRWFWILYPQLKQYYILHFLPSFEDCRTEETNDPVIWSLVISIAYKVVPSPIASPRFTVNNKITLQFLWRCWF